MCTCSKSTAFALLTLQTVIILIIAYFTTSSYQWTANPPTLLHTVLTQNNNKPVGRILENKKTQNGSNTIGLNYFPDLLSLYNVKKLSAPKLPRAVSDTDYVTLMRLLDLTVKVLEEYSVKYVLAYGSLIGSYVMHDILPWDDDVDVFIHNDTKAKVLDIFQNDSHYGIQGYHYHQSSGQIIKLFFNSSNSAGKYSWKWPFIDIVSYIERGNSIVPVEKASGSRFAIPKSSFYPFHKRPFGPLWLNAPHDPVILFRSKYKTFYCRSGFWDHQKETDRQTLYSPCHKLRQYYPFVKRRKVGNRTEEMLELDGKPLYKVTIDEPYHRTTTVYQGWSHTS